MDVLDASNLHLHQYFLTLHDVKVNLKYTN